MERIALERRAAARVVSAAGIARHCEAR